MINIKLYVNNNQTQITPVVNVSDTDLIEFEIDNTENDEFFSSKIEVFLEDYTLPLMISEPGNRTKTQANNLFRESFGYSTVRFFNGSREFTSITFNVFTNHDRFEEIKGMMSYLLKHNEHILDVCLSRTKYKSNNEGALEASFESIITLAEKITETLLINSGILKGVLRHRLQIIKEEVNNQNYYNINPHDIIDNIDKLQQGYSQNSINLFGKIYSLENIKRENYVDTYDLEENRILLGGLISIRETLTDISNTINNRIKSLNYDKEYEKIKPFPRYKIYSIEDMYAQITTDGMEKRIDNLVTDIDRLILLFTKKLQVKFKGFIPPKATPFARKSSFYLNIYKKMSEWYSLASPNIGVDQNLTKIRSTSKIYELFSLYKIIEALHADGWRARSSENHSFFKDFIPTKVSFYKEDSDLDVYYDRKVTGYTHGTRHNELIALNKNDSSLRYNYYNPDFIITKYNEQNVSFFILDSKYSSSYTLQQYNVLDELYKKYFSNFAVYNAVDGILEKHPIKSVIAIHPFGRKTLEKWPNLPLKITPDVSTIFLSKEKNDLSRVIDLINQTHLE